MGGGGGMLGGGCSRGYLEKVIILRGKKTVGCEILPFLCLLFKFLQRLGDEVRPCAIHCYSHTSACLLAGKGLLLLHKLPSQQVQVANHRQFPECPLQVFSV